MYNVYVDDELRKEGIMANKKLLTLGEEAKHLSKPAQDRIEELWKKLPTEDADIEQHAEHVADVREFKTELSKIIKHVNRHFVIANTQHMKAKMRAHNAEQLSIFDFGIKEEGEE